MVDEITFGPHDETATQFAERTRRGDSACEECVREGKVSVGLIVDGFRCLYHLNKGVAQLERNYANMAKWLEPLRQASDNALLTSHPQLYPLHTEGDLTTIGPRQDAVQFPTLESLVDAIERLFDCRDGYYGAYADGPTDGKRVEDIPKREGMRYVSIAIITNVSEDSEQRLRQAMYEGFVALRVQLGRAVKPVLYWRYAASERFAEEADLDIGRIKIRTRVAIPDADWSKCQWVHTEGGMIAVL